MLSGGWCAGWRLFCHRDQARICDSRALTQRDASEDQLKSPVPSLTSVHVLAGQVASEPDAASRRCILAVIPGGTVCGRQSSDRGTSVVGALLTIPFFKTAIAERYLPHWGRPCKHLFQLKTLVGSWSPMTKGDTASICAGENRIEEREGAAMECTHLDQIRKVKPSAKGCEDCLKIGGTWVHLRMCMECGHVGCCDSSENKHATKHFHKTKHPIMRSIEPGESWGWCYIDEVEVDEAWPS